MHLTPGQPTYAELQYKKGVFFLMFDPHTAIVVSIFLGGFIATAKHLEAPVMLLGGWAALGIYYFLFLHNILLAILKQVAALGH
ncbi:MAG TPA: hypothetical protein DCS91_03000 [Microcoleaceae bacterium UBA11344]|nr:hypothetical protein [Microcoleaceae cyanobacterium UBA11344]